MTAITEDAAELISEHERLVRVLRSPDHQDDLREAKRQARELSEYRQKAKVKQWPIKKPATADRPAVEMGDELYFQHPKTGPRSGKVIAQGAHGVTLQCAAGQRHSVRWDRVLGAKQRIAQDFDLVDQGEEGAIVADDQGQRRFMKWPEEDEQGKPLQKAQPSAVRILFFKAQQHALFSTPVQVHGHTRADGTFVVPYVSRRKKRLDAGPQTRPLFETVEHPHPAVAAATNCPELTLQPPVRRPATASRPSGELFTAPKPPAKTDGRGGSGGGSGGNDGEPPQEHGPFGPIFRQFYHDDQGAIAHLKQRQTGEAVAALYHPEVGDIDLVWGETSDNPRNKGRGVAKLEKWHPEVLEDLQGVLLRMKVYQRHKDIIHLRGGSLRGAVKLTFDDQRKTWLLTAYDADQMKERARDASGGIPASSDAKAVEMNPAPSNSVPNEQSIPKPTPADKVEPTPARSYRTPAAEQLAATLKAGDLKGALAVLAPLSLRDAEETLLYAGFPMVSVKTKAALLTHIQPYLMTAAHSRTDGFDMPQPTAKSFAIPTDAHILFFKAGPIKNRPGLALQTLTDSKGHTTQRWKRTTEKPKAEPRAHAADPDPQDQRGSAHGYGTHDIQPGSHVKFKVGDYASHGQVTAVGSAGATVKDAEGRPHRVHYHEITHHAPSEAAQKQPTNSAVLGKQDPIPAASFVAADYAKSHDQADVTADKIISQFPPDTEGRIKAAQQRLSNIEQTIDRFKQDGKWNAQREVLHHKIIADILSPERVKAATPAHGEKPTFMILGGRGGSGKSSFKGTVYDKSKFIVLDADELKGELPEYQGWNAHQVHEESSDIFEQITNLAQNLGLNICHDATMKTGKKAVELVKRFKDAGYRTEAHYMHLPRQEAAKRAVGRFINGGEKGRYVPVDVVLSNTSNEASFDSVKPLVDKWSFRDNNVPKGSKPILISESGESQPLKKSMESAIERAIQNHKPLLIRRM